MVKSAFDSQTFRMVNMPLRYFNARRYFIVKESYFKEDEEGGSSSKHVEKSQSSRSTFTMKESIVKENKKTFLLSKSQSSSFGRINSGTRTTGDTHTYMYMYNFTSVETSKCTLNKNIEKD